MKIKTRNFSAQVVRAEEDPANTVRVIASEAVEDRYGDIVDQETWVLESFKKNPVILFGHCSWNPPVGKAEVEVQGGRLMATITFDVSEANANGRLMAHQYANGFMNAVSVGFRSKKYTLRNMLPKTHPYYGERGLLLQDNELLEISCVPIPALPTALAQRGLSLRDAGEEGEEPEAVDTDMSFALMVLESSSDQIQQAALYLEKGKDPDLRKLASSLIAQATGRMTTVQDWIAVHAEDVPQAEGEAEGEKAVASVREFRLEWV